MSPLHVRGNVDLLTPGFPGWRVAVLGARACTEYGQLVANDLGHDLGTRGVQVVTGGGYGVDAAATRGALVAGRALEPLSWMPPVVLLPCGIDVSHPRGNADLFDDVVAAGGAVASPYDDGSVPTRARIMERNQLLARLVDLVVIVEAVERSTVRHVLDAAAARPIPIYAVPGPLTSVQSELPHRLIATGQAHLARSAADITLNGAILPEAGRGAGQSVPTVAGTEFTPFGI